MFRSKSISLQAFGLVLLAAAQPALAARIEASLGPSFMDSHATTAAFVEATFDNRSLASSAVSWAPDISLGWIDGRSVPGFRGGLYPGYRIQHAVGLFAAGARFQIGAADRWYRYLFFSEQLAATNHTSYALSSHYQFVSTFGWQARHLTVALRHISNGGLHQPNAGETMLVVGVAFNL